MKTLKMITLLLAITFAIPCFAQRMQTPQRPIKFLPPPPDANKDITTKNIGLQLYSLRQDIGRNFDELIAKIGAMGYKYVETASYAPGKFYGLSPEEFKAKLAANGLFALSSHTGKALARDISQTNWQEVWAWWDQAIADHKAAGMKYIIVAALLPVPETLEDLQAYCDYFNKIGEKCAAAGLMFGYHNHNWEFEKKYPDGSVMFDYMLTHTDPGKVFFELDVYWTVMGRRSPVEIFKKYPGRFLVLHIKDDKELGESGMVGFDAIFKNAETAGAKYLIVEVEKYDFTPIESVKMSLDYLINAPFVKNDYSH